jgi:hypothetical protein
VTRYAWSPACGTQWEQVDPGHYVNNSGDTITRTGHHRWELEGMVRDTTAHRTLRAAMDHADRS